MRQRKRKGSKNKQKDQRIYDKHQRKISLSVGVNGPLVYVRVWQALLYCIMYTKGAQGREKTNKHNFLIALLSARCRHTALSLRSLVLTCWVCLMKRNSSKIIHQISGAILKMSPNQREVYQTKWRINRSFTSFYVLERKRFCRKINLAKCGRKYDLWNWKLRSEDDN